MVNGSYLLRRGDTFSFRCRVPMDLRQRTQRREIVRALGVSKHIVAKLFAAAIALSLERLWKRARMAETSEEFNQLIEVWFDAERERVWRQFATGDLTRDLVSPTDTRARRLQINRAILGEDADATLQALQGDFAAGDYAAAAPISRAIVAKLPEPFDEADQRFAILSKLVMQGMGEIQEARLRWASGEEHYRPTFPPIAPLSTEPAEQAVTEPTDEDTTTLREAIATFLELRKREKNPTAKQLGQLASQLECLVEAFGPDRKITAISSLDAGQVFQALRFLPADFRSHSDLEKLSFFDAAQKARTLGLMPRSPKTINNYMTSYRGLFNAEIKLGRKIDKNPFEGMTVDVPDEGESERAFEDPELQAILKQPVFTGCLRDNRPFDVGGLLLSDWRFWAPLIAYLTGARIAEIVQLRPQDIREIEGVWAFDFNDADDKRLKTRTSRRRVPVHPQLIRLGLLDYAKKRKEMGASTLLGIPVPKNGNAGHKPGNWFRERFLPSALGTKRPGTGWHSFRHSLETRLRAAGVRDDVGNRITGHATPGVGPKYGSFGMEVLRDALLSLEVPAELAAIPSRTS